MSSSRYLIIISVILGIGVIVLFPVFKSKIYNQELERGLIQIAGTSGDESFLLYFAQNEGYFRDEEIDVSIPTFESGELAGSELINRRYDLAVMTDFNFANLLATNEKTADLRILASIATLDNYKILSRKHSDIATPADLIGKKIGVSGGSLGEFFLEQFLGRNGLNINSLEIIYDNPGKLIELITEKRIDAVIVGEPYVYKIRQIFNFDINSWPAQNGTKPHFLLVSRKSWLESHKDEARKILRALIRAEETTLSENKKAKVFFQQRSSYSNQYTELVLLNYEFAVTLSSKIISMLEDYNKWTVKNKNGNNLKSNYSDLIYFEGLGEVKPGAFRN